MKSQQSAGGYSRSREKNDAVRATLKPLAPNERPLAVTIAAVIAAVLAVLNLVFLAQDQFTRQSSRATPGLVFCVVMTMAAVLMWRGTYWATLCFQGFLAVTIAVAGVSLLVAGNFMAVLLSVTVIVAAGTLFWFLIRPLARLQMPRETATRTDKLTNEDG